MTQEESVEKGKGPPAVALLFVKPREKKGRAEDGKSYLTGTFPYRLQSLDGLADHLATVAIYDRPDDYFRLMREFLSAHGPPSGA